MTKQYGVPIIIGERTAEAVLIRFAALEIDHLQVRGKREWQRIFTVLGRADVATNHDFALLNERNGVMLAAYRHGEWSLALEMIFLCRELGKKFELDDYYDLYLQRVRHRIEPSASSS